METMRWKLRDQIDIDEAIEVAARILREGSTIAFPTETVYGLGADATNEAAVGKIFTAKGRPSDNPLIAHVANKTQLLTLVSHLPLFAEQLMDAFSPGPITFVLPSSGICAPNVTAGLATIAVRMPNHPVAQQLLEVCNIPIAAPSANISGKPSPTRGQHVWEDLSGKISGLLDAGQTGVGVESTVIDCTNEEGPIILRPGGITKEQLEAVVGPIFIEKLGEAEEQPMSPGMKYKHYTPEVPLWIVEGSSERLQQVINEQQSNSLRVGVFASSDLAKELKADHVLPLGDNLSDIAVNLYDALRYFKRGDIDVVISQSFEEVGLGVAIMDRLRKAATTII